MTTPTQPTSGPFQVEIWTRSGAQQAWLPMVDDIAERDLWRPFTSAFQAALTCEVWRGGVGIPVMRVVDLSSGGVVWQDSDRDPSAGPSIEPAWGGAAALAALAQLQDLDESQP